MTLAIVFDSVGAGEWLVLLAVLLIVMGPKRLPSTARKIGSYYSKFRRAADSFKRQLMDMDLEMERELRKAEQEVESSMKVPEMNEEPGAASADESPDDEPMRDYGDDPMGDYADAAAESAAPAETAVSAEEKKSEEVRGD